MIHPLFSEYGGYHTDPRNRAMHEVGIPLIVLGIAALLALVRIGPVDLAALALAAIVIFYLTIDVPSALVALAGYAVIYTVALRTPWWLAIVAFVVGWAFQFIGHVFEGKKPAFLTNLVHLLVGPLWIAALLANRAGGTARNSRQG